MDTLALTNVVWEATDALVDLVKVGVVKERRINQRKVRARETTVGEAEGVANMLGRTYLVTYTDGRGQAQTERGHLVALDQEGFVVLEVNGKHLLIPKARVDVLLELE